MTEPTTNAAPSSTVQGEVRPCEFTGFTNCDACPAPKCFYEPDDEGETYDYEEGMAPRTDATDKALANRSPREQYVIMRAHARALEIELRDVGPNASNERRQEPPERKP